MTSRSRQARRTPHSSSGNINFGSPSPEGQYARHHEYTQHSSQSNPSLPSLGSGAAAGIPAQERIVKNLVDKLNVKLPCHSGVRISDLEVDQSSLQVIEALQQLSRHCINVIVWSLCEILDKLSKRGPENVEALQSEFYVVRVLMAVLTFHWNTSTEERAMDLEETVDSVQTLPPKRSDENLPSNRVGPLDDPPALDDHVAKYALVAMITFIRRCGPTKADNVRANDREYDEITHEADKFDMDMAVLHAARQLPMTAELRLNSTIKGTSQASGSSERMPAGQSVSSLSSGAGTPSVAKYIPSALAVRSTAQAAVAPMVVTHIAGRVIYRLSATNWSIVFSRIRNKIHFLAAHMSEEGQDIIDLRLVTYCLIDKNRLLQVLQELSSLLVNMKSESQGAVAVALRTVIWNWIETFTDEFIDVVLSSRRRLDGQPERVFDLLYQLIEPGNRRLLWPTLAVLMAVSPERLAAAEAAMNGTLKYGRKYNSFLEQLQSALTTQSKLGEFAIMCYNDICRAAFYIPPLAGDNVLRSLAPDLADDLKTRLMTPSPPSRPFYDSLEPIDITLYSDALVTIFRFHPMVLLVNILPICLELDRSHAVKLCAIRALSILVTEGPKFPWQPALDKTLYNLVSPRLRFIAADICEPTGRSASYPLVSRDRAGQASDNGKSDDSRDLLISLLDLWRLDIGFCLSNMKDDECVPIIESSIKNLVCSPRDEGIQHSWLRTFGSVLSRLNNPVDEYADIVHAFLYHASVMVLYAAADKLLQVMDDLEENALFINLVLAILSQFADRSTERHKAWKLNEKRLTALAATDIALNTALASPSLEVCSLAARGLRLMALIEQDPDAPPPEQYTPEQARIRIPLLEVIGDPNIVILGRVEFQKRVRLTLSQSTFSCTTHVAVWRELYYRWISLTTFVIGTTTRFSADPLAGASSQGLTPEERQMAWENITLILACSGNACLSDDRMLNPPLEHEMPFHPGISDEIPSEMIRKFTMELTNLLTHSTVPIQIVARDALGTELTPKLFQVLFDILDLRIRETFGSTGDSLGLISAEQHKTIFADQVTSVLKLIMDRISDADAILIKIDIGEILYSLARFLHHGRQMAFELRIKARFCALVDIVLQKREALRIRQEVVVRNKILDVVADWILESPGEWPEDELGRSETSRVQRDSTLAALKTCVNLLDGLSLQANDGATPSDTSHVVSRLFHRYFAIFIKAFSSHPNGSHSIVDYDRSTQLSMYGGKYDALVQELVVSGIANMLHANTDPGTKHVLSLGYKDDPRLRTLFAHVFCRVLSRGTKFDHYLEGLAHNNRKSKLCEMVKESEIIAQAIIDICPMSEIDTIVPVLLNIFDTRRTLLNLLKMVIQRQVDTTSSDNELFRANDICSRLLSAFARLHGYNYLRSILSPLITSMTELPVGSGYELDPSKLRPGETQEENAKNLKMITKAFLEVISESVPIIPPLIREVCRYIEKAVIIVWPESRYSAVQAFIFLRFIVPAIVSPETVDIEMPRNEPRASTMRRGLLLVAKIIQNLANNILFGKEAHMTLLNSFLEDHIIPLARFHSDILKPADEAAPNPGEWLGTSYDETDTIVLHRFFQKHADKVGKVLLSLSRMTNSHDAAAASGKRTWDYFCNLLMELGVALEPPTLTDKPSNKHQAFERFMAKNRHRNMDPVREIFQNTTSLKDQRPLFVLALSKLNVETVDLELLMCHIFKTIQDMTAFEQSFDVIIDCTAFTTASEVPITWCKLYLEHLPSDLRQHFEVAYILNSNPVAQKFLRKLYHVCSESKFANQVIAVSSIAELAGYVHLGSSTPMPYTLTLENEPYSRFSCHQHVRNQLRIPIHMQVGISHIRITSVKTQSIYPTLSCKTVEIVPLVDIGDVASVASRVDGTEFVIRRIVNGNTISFSSSDRDKVVEAIRVAKNRLKAVGPLIPMERSRLSDVSATLLNVGLLNVCDEDESLRGAAYDLLFAVCAYVNYEANPLVPLRGPFIPSNTAAFILPFSEHLANFVPQLTLDLIAEFSVGFEKASTAQKITCLQYLNPWIKNLALFATPTHRFYEPTSGKLKESIRTLVDITVKFPDVVYPSLQRSVWAELAKHDTLLLNIALEELMRAAVDGGLGSRRCEQVADTLIAMSSINVRARVLMKLRRVLFKASGKATRSLSQSPSWSEISALARLVLVAGYSSRLAVQNQLYVPEIAHLTTMLCATGTLQVKTTIYGIAMNLIQSLHIARAEAEGSATQLKRLLDEASHPDVLRKFGLVHAYPSSEYSSIEYPSDQIPLQALEGITQLLIEALTYGAQSTGLLNVWRGRWMSLVTSTAFQVCPYVQYRAFVVLGLLASSDTSEVDDDLLYQMLVAFKHALTFSAENDPAAVMSMLRCIARVVPGLNPDSRYLPQVFWLAVALLQSTYLPLYEEAARLLEVTLEAMAHQGFFENRQMSTVLLEARGPLSDITTQLDDIMGLSFDTGFSFSLASIIFRGIRPPAVRPVAKALLKTVLRIAAGSSGHDNDIDLDTATPIPLNHDLLGYFLALLPFACTPRSYRELLRDSGVSTRWSPLVSEEEDAGSSAPTISTELFGFAPEDSKTPLLVISFLFAMLNSYQGSEKEKGFLFTLLAQLAVLYPEFCASAVVHYLTNPRSEWLLSNLTETFVGSAETASAVQVLFRTAMTSPAWSAVASSTLLGPGEDGSISQRTQHYKALEDLDMHSLSGTWQFLPKGDASKVLQWIPQLVDAIID